jgi:hypothetical protein
MKKILLSTVLTIGLLGTGIAAQSANPMSEKEASPTLKERLTKDTIKGTLMRTEGEYYFIKDNDGKEQKVHVDKSTKLDKVLPGDMVKAYVTDQGHTTTLERVNWAGWRMVFWQWANDQEDSMARYGKRAHKSVERTMHKRKKGTLKSGKSGKPVKSRKQAVAIGLSEARRKGAKVPKKKAA